MVMWKKEKMVLESLVSEAGTKIGYVGTNKIMSEHENGSNIEREQC